MGQHCARWTKQVLSTLEALRREGRTRAIGVCNFNLPMLQRAIEDLQAPTASVQVEYHPFLDQSQLLAYLHGRNIPLTAYAPLAQGRAASDETLVTIGKKHGVSGAQVAIAWLLEQPGVIAIPKAQRLESQRANFAALDIRLDDEDCEAIARLPKDLRYVKPPFAHDWDATSLQPLAAGPASGAPGPSSLFLLLPADARCRLAGARRCAAISIDRGMPRSPGCCARA